MYPSDFIIDLGDRLSDRTSLWMKNRYFLTPVYMKNRKKVNHKNVHYILSFIHTSFGIMHIHMHIFQFIYSFLTLTFHFCKNHMNTNVKTTSVCTRSRSRTAITRMPSFPSMAFVKSRVAPWFTIITYTRCSMVVFLSFSVFKQD